MLFQVHHVTATKLECEAKLEHIRSKQISKFPGMQVSPQGAHLKYVARSFALRNAGTGIPTLPVCNTKNSRNYGVLFIRNAFSHSNRPLRAQCFVNHFSSFWTHKSSRISVYPWPPNRPLYFLCSGYAGKLHRIDCQFSVGSK